MSIRYQDFQYSYSKINDSSSMSLWKYLPRYCLYIIIRRMSFIKICLNYSLSINYYWPQNIQNIQNYIACMYYLNYLQNNCLDKLLYISPDINNLSLYNLDINYWLILNMFSMKYCNLSKFCQ